MNMSNLAKSILDPTGVMGITMGKPKIETDRFENISYPVAETAKADWLDVMADAFFEKIEHEPRIGKLNRSAILGLVEEYEEDREGFVSRLMDRLEREL